MGLSENRLNPEKPNGFADHYPVFKLLFHWEYTQHFQTNPNIWVCLKLLAPKNPMVYENKKPSINHP